MDQQAPVNPWKTQDSPWRWELHLLLLSAMIVFVLTVVIGIVNGQQVVKLSQRVILTHVHAGTLGWITLSVFAIALYLFGEDTTIPAKSMYLRVLSIVAAVTLPIYVLAFLSGNLIARAVFGIPTLLVFLGFFGWIIARSGKLRLGIPHLAILAAMLALIIGGVFGVHRVGRRGGVRNSGRRRDARRRHRRRVRLEWRRIGSRPRSRRATAPG